MCKKIKNIVDEVYQDFMAAAISKGYAFDENNNNKTDMKDNKSTEKIEPSLPGLQ